MTWQPDKQIRNPISLNEYEEKDLRIVKQAVLKSFIEAGAICERTEESEKLVEGWVKWVYRCEEKDYKLVKEQENPF